MTRHLTFVFLFLITNVFAQLQSPAEFLGYEIGSEFSRHADVVRYFEHVATNSNMVNYCLLYTSDAADEVSPV